MASYAPQNTIGRPGGIRPGFPGKQPRPGIPLPGGKQPRPNIPRPGPIDQDQPAGYPRNGGIPGYQPGMVRPPITKPGGPGQLQPIGNRRPGQLQPIDNGRPRSPYDSSLRPARSQAITPQILQQMARRRLGG